MTISSDTAPLAAFVERNVGYYSHAFQHMAQQRLALALNLAAFVAGPLWAAARRLWGLDERACNALLRALVEEQFLFRTSNGAFMRVETAKPVRTYGSQRKNIAAA